MHIYICLGFLCGKCSNPNQGTALNLIECVSCEVWHKVLFILICKFALLYVAMYYIYTCMIIYCIVFIGYNYLLKYFEKTFTYSSKEC